jgi:3-phosphoshikimate 1-carboxyvinyltransferase
MDITIFPEKLYGSVASIPSKSHAHRLMVCAALADQPTRIEIPTLCGDLVATISCISGLGGDIEHCYGLAEIISPIRNRPVSTTANCGESGSTLRFFLPLAGALGIDTLFHLEGRLPYRPLSPLWEEMERNGCHLSWQSRSAMMAASSQISRSVTAGLHLSGQLRPGHYRIDGGVSSQFISGLLMALPLLNGESHLELMGRVESKPYVDLTLQTLSQFGVNWNDFHCAGNQKFISPGTVKVEGDWSSAAFWLAADSIGSQIEVTGLDPNSVQGDKVISNLLVQLKEHMTISAADIPDLVPILAIVASANKGAVITDVRRLRLKESDRVHAIVEMLNALGGKATADENTLTIYPAELIGGTVDSYNDHRIAMAAAIASTICKYPVTILGADCVIKSYPSFWKEFTRLGGKI